MKRTSAFDAGAAWAVTRNELRLLLRDPAGLAMLFVLPAVFIVILSVALQGVFSSDKEEDRLAVAFIDEDGGVLAARIRDELEATGNFKVVTGDPPAGRTEVLRELGEGRLDLVVSVPEGSSAALKLEGQATVEVILDPAISVQIAQAVQSMITGIVAGATLEQMLTEIRGALKAAAAEAVLPRGPPEASAQVPPEASAQVPPEASAQVPPAACAQVAPEAPPRSPPPAASGVPALPDPAGPPGMDWAAARRAWTLASSLQEQDERGVRVERVFRTQQGIEIHPNVVQQNVPGWTIFALFWIAQVLVLNRMLERSIGIDVRLLASPINSLSYITGKVAPYLIVNLLQAVAMFAVGTLVVPLLGCPRLELPNLPALAVMTLAISVVALSFGIMMATLVRSITMGVTVTAVILLIMAVIAGIMVPRFVMPQVMQQMSWWTPQGWALDGYLHVLLRGADTRGILGHVGILLAFAVPPFAVAVWRRRELGA